MRAAKHIAFFFKTERIPYINRILEEVANYPFDTDVFLHVNCPVSSELFRQNTKGTLNIVVHDVSANGMLLPSMTRHLLKEQRHDYDIFMYIEDDILVPKEAIEYWLRESPLVKAYGFNLGFLRVERDAMNEEYLSDLMNEHCIPTQMNIIYMFSGKYYALNNINPYCAFWIYDKEEFNRFVDSRYYDPANIPRYGVREAVAIGLHGVSDPTMNWYKGTLIPLEGIRVVDGCKIYHLPNTFVNDCGSIGATMKLEEAVSFHEHTRVNIQALVQRKNARLMNEARLKQENN